MPPHHSTIGIDRALLSKAMKATGAQTPREVVELGLKTLSRLRGQAALCSLRGKLRWAGDLAAMRRN